MGGRLAKPPPLDRPIAPPRGPIAGLARPFPVLTPQSYIPGGTGLFPGIPPGRGSNFPVLNQNSFLPPGGGLEPPIMNLSGGTGMFPQSMPYPPVVAPQMQYPNQNMMSMAPQPSFYEPGLRSCSRRRPVRVCRRRRRTRRCRPVIHVIDSSSCSSLSSCGTRSSCSRRRHHSHSRRRESTPQQQQQPIILLPIQCQQPAPTPAPNLHPPQAQQIILPPIQVQQSGQIQPQQFALPQISSQQQFALPPISSQQQHLALPPIQLSSSNFAANTGSMMIPSGQPMLPTTLSLPQITNIGQGQPIQSGAIQYVQSGRQSSSPLQYISAQPRSTVALQRGLVNSSNKKQSTIVNTVARSASVRNVPQNDLKYGRRPFDWYGSEKKNNIIDENTQIGQRGSTSVR